MNRRGYVRGRRVAPKKNPKPNFSNDVAEWWRGLTFGQCADVQSWLSKNQPPNDWQGTPIEWAYLSMPVPGGW